MRSSSSAAATPAPRPRSPARGWAARRCCSRTTSKRWARCRAIRRSAASARGTWSRRSTRSAARWRSPPTRRASSSAPSIRARGRRCGRRARRPTGCSTRQAIRRRLENQPNLTLFQQAVDDLTLDGDGAGARVTGVITQMGVRFEADAVVLTTGTFLSGLIHVGLEHYEAGRAAIRRRRRSARACASWRCPSGRLKTGTPPRLDGRTIDFSALDEQPGDDPAPVFELHRHARDASARRSPCWITHTNERTHEIIRGGLDRSPLFTGVIKGVGPRYCPSIEDKVVRFAERDEPPDLPRARGPRDERDLSERHLDVAAVRRAAGAGALDRRAASTRTSCGPATRSNTTTSIRARSRPRSRPRRSAASSSPGRSTARRATRKPRRRGCSPASTPRASCAARRAGAPRRDEAYLGVLVDDLDHARRDRAVPDVHLARRIPAAAARGQRRSAPDRARPRARRRRRRALGRVRAQARRRRARARAAEVDVR